uniref:U2-Austrotoxin-Ht1a_1 n=1 Tax=Hickmania troglodytes TaxID=489260 RepID=A0A482ZHI9_9ARAC
MMCKHDVWRGGHCSSAFSVVLLVLFVVMATGQILRNEHNCLAEGGICAVNSSCPEGKRINRTGLCPEQEPEGAVCCNGVPDGVDSCHAHGGRCGYDEECRNVRNFGQLDCENGSNCCLLIF